MDDKTLGPYETVVLSPLDRRLLRDVNTTLTMIYERLCDLDERWRSSIAKDGKLLREYPLIPCGPQESELREAIISEIKKELSDGRD